MILPCPRCGHDLTPGADAMVTCTCGFRGYCGYVQEYTYLTARLAWVRDRLDEGAAAPDPEVAAAYGIWKPPAPANPQTLLVTLGAGLLILAAFVFVAVAWQTIGPWGQIGSLFALTAALGAAAVLLPTRAPRAAEALATVSWAVGVICANAAPNLGALPAAWGQAEHPYRLIVFVVATAWGIGLGPRFGLRAWTWLGWVTTPLVLGLGLALALQDVTSDHVLVTAGGVAFVVFGLALLALARGGAVWPMRVAGTLGLALASALTAGALTFEPPAGAALIVATALSGCLLMRLEWAVWPLLGLLAALLMLFADQTTTSTAVAGLLGALLLFGVAIRRPPGLAMLAAGTLWTTYLIGTAGHRADVMAAIAGLAVFGLSLRRAAAPLAWFGAGLVWLAVLPSMADPVPFFEMPTLILAALLLIAGLIGHHAGIRRSTIVYGPALILALLPSAFACWVDVGSQPSLTRFAIVLLVGVVLLIVGVKQRMLGLVIPATAAVSIAATAQIWATLQLVPRWLALGIAGTALIALGARIDWVRTRGRQTEKWLQTLQ